MGINLTQEESFKMIGLEGFHTHFDNIENELDLPVKSKNQDIKTHKIASAVQWEKDSDSEEERNKCITEFVDDIKSKVQGNVSIVADSFHVFGDPTLQNRNKLGFYGWVEVVSA